MQGGRESWLRELWAYTCSAQPTVTEKNNRLLNSRPAVSQSWSSWAPGKQCVKTHLLAVSMETAEESVSRWDNSGSNRGQKVSIQGLILG